MSLPIGNPTAEEVNQMLRDDCHKRGLPFQDYSEVVEVSIKHVPNKDGTFWTPARTRPKVTLHPSTNVSEWTRIEKVKEICARWLQDDEGDLFIIAPSGSHFNNLVMWKFEGTEVTFCSLRFIA